MSGAGWQDVFSPKNQFAWKLLWHFFSLKCHFPGGRHQSGLWCCTRRTAPSSCLMLSNKYADFWRKSNKIKRTEAVTLPWLLSSFYIYFLGRNAKMVKISWKEDFTYLCIVYYILSYSNFSVGVLILFLRGVGWMWCQVPVWTCLCEGSSLNSTIQPS